MLSFLVDSYGIFKAGSSTLGQPSDCPNASEIILNDMGKFHLHWSTTKHMKWEFRAQWASYQIRKIAGCACAGNAGNVFPRRRFRRKPLVSDPGMHHGTCVTHVPWCMPGSLTCGDGENVPGIPSACAPAILRIWKEAHSWDVLYLGTTAVDMMFLRNVPSLAYRIVKHSTIRAVISLEAA